MSFKVGDRVSVESAQLNVSNVDGEVVEILPDRNYPYRVKLNDPTWNWPPVFFEDELTPIPSLWQEGDKPNYPVAHVTARWVEATELDNAGWEPEVAYHELGSTDTAGNDTWFISHDGIGRHFYNSYADLENDIAAE